MGRLNDRDLLPGSMALASSSTHLEFSGDLADYQPAVFCRFEGVEVLSLGALIYAHEQHDIAVTGKGILSGPSAGLVPKQLPGLSEQVIDVTQPVPERVFDGSEGGPFFRPYFIAPVACRNVLIEGVTLRQGPMWNIVPIYCRHVIVRGVHIDSRGVVNGDGVNIESSQNVLVNTAPSTPGTTVTVSRQVGTTMASASTCPWRTSSFGTITPRGDSAPSLVAVKRPEVFVRSTSSRCHQPVASRSVPKCKTNTCGKRMSGQVSHSTAKDHEMRRPMGRMYALLWVILAVGAQTGAGQALGPDAEDAAAAAYARLLTERSDKIVAALQLRDAALAVRVRDMLVDQYRTLNEIHAARDVALAALPDSIQADPSRLDAARTEIKDRTDADICRTHRRFVARLQVELEATQVDQIKDGMTYGILPVTYRRYLELLPTLTDQQRRDILAELIEAREHAMDAGSAEEKHAWFRRYKGRINNHLSKAGYDLKQAEAELRARQISPE